MLADDAQVKATCAPFLTVVRSLVLCFIGMSRWLPKDRFSGHIFFFFQKSNTFSSSLDLGANTWERLLQGIAEESEFVCARVLFAVRICMEIICIPSLGQQAGRTLNRVGIHLCCRVVQLPLSNWEKRVCVCAYVCVHSLATRAHPNTSGPAAAAELILALVVRTPQFPQPGL